MDTEPRHGEVRNHQTKVIEGRRAEYLDAKTGEIYTLAPVTLTTFADERYCACCRQWFQVQGIFGVLKFDFEHDHGRPRAGS